MAKLGVHAVQEHSQGSVAPPLAAGFTLAADGDVAGALLFAAVVEVAGFGCIQTRVAVFLSIRTLKTFGCNCEHPLKRDTYKAH